MRDDMELVKADYEALVNEHAPDYPQCVGWRDQATQHEAYSALLSPTAAIKRGRVLDIGCGRAYPLTMDYVGPFTSYTGVDFMGYHIDYCKHKYGKLENIKFYEAEAIEWLEHQSDKWDTVIASGVLAHYSAVAVRDLLARMFYVTDVNGYMAFNWNRLTSSLRVPDVLIILNDIGVERYVLRHDYNANDYTVYCYK
jgi:SAM-dependent methyltransferase